VLKRAAKTHSKIVRDNEPSKNARSWSYFKITRQRPDPGKSFGRLKNFFPAAKVAKNLKTFCAKLELLYGEMR